MKTIKEWHAFLSKLSDGTDFRAIIKEDITNPVVALVPKYLDSPQRIAIYPKKTKNAGLVVEQDVYEVYFIQRMLGGPSRVHSNRPHFKSVEDDIIVAVCSAFLMGR